MLGILASPAPHHPHQGPDSFVSHEAWVPLEGLATQLPALSRHHGLRQQGALQDRPEAQTGLVARGRAFKVDFQADLSYCQETAPAHLHPHPPPLHPNPRPHPHHVHRQQGAVGQQGSAGALVTLLHAEATESRPSSKPGGGGDGRVSLSRRFPQVLLAAGKACCAGQCAKGPVLTLVPPAWSGQPLPLIPHWLPALPAVGTGLPPLRSRRASVSASRVPGSPNSSCPGHGAHSGSVSLGFSPTPPG